MDKKILIGGILVLAVIAFMFRGAITGEVISEGSDVKIPLSDISTKAKFYEYERISSKDDSGEPKYFVVKSGYSVKTAFDACDVCYNAGKGYSQQGDNMVCNNCGNHYPINGLGTRNLRGGGCWPGYLPSKIQGDYLVIKKSDLETGRYRF